MNLHDMFVSKSCRFQFKLATTPYDTTKFYIGCVRRFDTLAEPFQPISFLALDLSWSPNDRFVIAFESR